MNNCQQPLFGEVGVLALVPDEWGPIWESRHQILSRLATYFQVVWVNNPHGWRNIFSRLRQTTDSSMQYPATEALQIYTPEPWLPIFGRPAWLADFTSRRRLKRASDRLRARGCTRIVLYVWRPEFAPAMVHIQNDFSIYHVDDEYSFSSTEVEISTAERHVLESAGQVFIHSPAMMKKKGRFNSNTAFVPNGVDYQQYATPVPEPDDLRNIPRPRIGYVGTLKRMMDWPLLLELSEHHSWWSFVFVGPKAPHAEIEGALEQMSRRPNAHFLREKPVDRLGGYPQHFDVCIMPYLLDDYTKYIYPLKMHEYLASGRPVISSPICSVEEFRDVIGVASTCSEWTDAIEHAISPGQDTPARCMKRQEIAREHDWNILVARIASTIAARLGIQIAGSSHPVESISDAKLTLLT